MSTKKRPTVSAGGILKYAKTGFDAARLAKGFYNQYAAMRNRPNLAAATPKAAMANGRFKKVMWRRKKPNAAKAKARKRFARKVRGVVAGFKDKSHYIVQNTLRIDGLSGRVCFGQLAFATNTDLLEARRKTIFNQSGTQHYDQNKLYVMNHHVEIFMVNPTNTCLYVDMYDIRRKGTANQDNNESPLGWLETLSRSTNAYDNTGQPQGNQIEDSTSNNYAVGFSLFQVPGFFSKFKIYKKTRILLQPGECVTKFFKRTKDWVWDPKKYPTSTGNAATPAPVIQFPNTVALNNNKTSWIMFGIFGQVVNDATVKSTISFSPSALNIAYTEDFTISQVADYAPAGVARNNIWVTSPFPTIAVPNIVQQMEAPIVARAVA